MEQEQEQIDNIRKMKKIKRIKRQKARKRIMNFFITIIIITLLFVGLYFCDKQFQICDGKFVAIIQIAKKNINSIINTYFIKNTEIANNTNQNTINENTINTPIKDEEEIAKENATNVAIKKFKELGEITTASELEVVKIKRKNELYYYISSKENTVEVRIEDNKITRINSVPVKEETLTNGIYNNKITQKEGI